MNTLITTLKLPQSCEGKAMKIILGILVGLVVIIALLFIFTGGLARTANEQLEAIKAGNIDAAYSMTSSAFQKETSLDAFKSFVNTYPVLKSYKSVSFSERNMENGEGYLAGEIEDADGSKQKIEFKLIKEDDKWKILGIRLSVK